ncbi:MAG TPA: Holliday junction branch migration protein RuvA [Opitutales bacterium]|nr:Holliday junction branch migration protein RuvA [Opitutales bacterium]
MFTYIEGKLASASLLHAVIDLQGLGYEVNIPITTAERLPAIGKRVKLATHVVYREDTQAVYGFATPEERDFFRLMIERVPGVGPKVGLSIMSKLSLPMLRSAIAASDIALLTKCPGIGKKTAERLVIELKDKVGLPSSAPSMLENGGDPAEEKGTVDTSLEDAVRALVTLGYRPAGADKAVRQALAEAGGQATSEALIKAALRRI